MNSNKIKQLYDKLLSLTKDNKIVWIKDIENKYSYKISDVVFVIEFNSFITKSHIDVSLIIEGKENLIQKEYDTQEDYQILYTLYNAITCSYNKVDETIESMIKKLSKL